MRNFIAKILMDKAGDSPAGGGQPGKEIPPPPGAVAKPAAAAEPPAAEAGGKEYDEYGYEKVPASPEEKPEPRKEEPKAGGKKEDPPPKAEDLKGNLTGYEEEAPEVKESEPKKDDGPPPPPPTDLDKKVEGLHKSFADKVKEQVARIQKKGLPAEKEKELIDEAIADKKKEQADAQAWGEKAQRDQALAVQKQKAAWHKELKEDPDFGGEKYLTNISRGVKVLDEYLPELKKELTDNKQMLRPSVMRGLARIADALYRDDKLVLGDPPAPEKAAGEKDEKSDPLAFYTN